MTHGFQQQQSSHHLGFSRIAPQPKVGVRETKPDKLHIVQRPPEPKSFTR